MIAEDPNTTADVLERFVEDVFTNWLNDAIGMKRQGHPLVEAVAAHPNTPPGTLIKLLNSEKLFQNQQIAAIRRVGLRQRNALLDSQDELAYRTVSVCARALCQNPIMPFLCLETPDFWERVEVRSCELQLREASLPTQVAKHLMQHSQDAVAQAAQFHISLAGDIQTFLDGQKAVTQYGRTLSLREAQEKDWIYKQYAELVRKGFAPAWVIGKQTTTKQRAPYDIGHRFFVERSKPKYQAMSRFTAFVANLYGASHFIYNSPQWFHRLGVALASSFPTTLLDGDDWNRSPSDLLNHFAHDGNRLVRWAAQTHLTDPNFVFTWDEGTGER